MLHCYLKIAYYVALIIYYCIDIPFDVIQLKNEMRNHGRFAGILTNSTTNKVVLCVSFGSGFICTLLMMAVYCYYIHFHLICIKKQSYRLLHSVQFERDTLLNCSDDNESKTMTCNRHFVLTELLISNIEMYLKDGIQSALLLYMYLTSDLSSIIQLNWHDIVFVVCNIVASLKLLFCFTTKLFGYGSGEKTTDCCSWKSILCMLGILGSIIIGILCILYLYISLA